MSETSGGKFHYNKAKPASGRITALYDVATDLPADVHQDVRYTLGVVFREDGKRVWDATSVHEELGIYGRRFKTREGASEWLLKRHDEWLVERAVAEVDAEVDRIMDEHFPDNRSDAQRYVDSRTPRKWARHG